MHGKYERVYEPSDAFAEVPSEPEHVMISTPWTAEYVADVAEAAVGYIVPYI